MRDAAEYLNYDFNNPVRDPVWGNIMFSDGMKKIISSPILQKMNGIRQLGPAYLVYPGAVHSRFCHSLGVYHMGLRIIRQLLTFSSCPRVSREETAAFLCGCLLHDLGHFPYAHSLKDLPLKTHESLTAEYILSEPLNTLIKDSLKIDPFLPAAIVDRSIETDSKKISFFRNILSGVLDPDKLDYLTRDAYFCGVPYGIQDIDFVLSSVYPHPEKGIGILKSGISAVENILFSKYMMYKTVYWHKTVRCATGMIKKALLSAMKNEKLNKEQLYDLSDETLFQIPLDRDLPAFRLFDMVRGRRLFKLVYEVLFDPQNLSHALLLDLGKRTEKEEELDREVSSAVGMECRDSVLIDIPEEINFETSLPVFENDDFEIFSGKEGISISSDSLRHIRVFVAPEIASQREKLRDIEWI